MNFSQETDKIIPALIKSQASFNKVGKNKTNTFFNNAKYADLASYIESCQPALIENDLLVTHDSSVEYKIEDNPAYHPDWQPKTNKDQKQAQPSPKIFVAYMSVTMKIIHSSGQWAESAPFQIITSNASAQGLGSCYTYGRRYTYSAGLGLSADDDDGNAGSNKFHKNQPVTEAPKDYRKIRAWLNQNLLNNTKNLDEFWVHVNTFEKMHGKIWDNLTGHNEYETFRNLADQHKERLEKAVPQKSEAQEAFEDAISKSEDRITFGSAEEIYFSHDEIQNPENEKILNAKGFELGIENYEDPTKEV